jgi:hypothetical protein
MKKKLEVKNLIPLSLPEKETVLQKIFIDFKNHPELRKKDLKVAELAGDCGKLWNCVSQILKVRNRSYATFFSVRNSAIDLVVRNIAELRRCGLKLRMPNFASYCCLKCNKSLIVN